MDRLYRFIDQVSPLRPSTWAALAPLFRPRRLPKGAYLAEAGRVETTAAYVATGILRAFYRAPDGAEYNKTFFLANDFAGPFSALVTGLPNQIYIQALTTCELFTADYPALTALYDAHPDWERFARRLAEGYFVRKEQRELQLALLTAEDRYRQFRAAYPDLERHVAQYHVASYLGITPTQLSRVRARVFGRQ